MHDHDKLRIGACCAHSLSRVQGGLAGPGSFFNMTRGFPWSYGDGAQNRHKIFFPILGPCDENRTPLKKSDKSAGFTTFHTDSHPRRRHQFHAGNLERKKKEGKKGEKQKKTHQFHAPLPYLSPTPKCLTHLAFIMVRSAEELFVIEK